MSTPDTPIQPEAQPAERRHLGAGAVVSTATQFTAMAIAALSSVIIARSLGPAGTGLFSLSVSFNAVLILVFGFGMRSSLVYLVSSGAWSSRIALKRGEMLSALFGLLGALVGIGVYVLGRDGFLDGITWPMGLAIAASLPFGLILGVAASIAIARERYEVFGGLQALPNLGVLAAGILAATSGIEAAVIGFAVAGVLSGLIALFWAERSITKDIDADERGRYRDAISFGAKAWGSDVLQYVNYRFDLFFINALVAISDVGLYSVALTVTSLAWILPQALSQAVLPRTAGLSGESERGRLDRSVRDEADARAARHGALLSLPVGAAIAGLLILAVPLLYGPEFSGAIALGLILIPGTLLLGVGKVLVSITVGRGHPEYSLYVVLAVTPPTVVGYLLLIPLLGTQGAALASSLSYAATFAGALFFFRRTTGLPFRRSMIPTRADVSEYRVVLGLVLKYGRDRMPRRTQHG